MEKRHLIKRWVADVLNLSKYPSAQLKALDGLSNWTFDWCSSLYRQLMTKPIGLWSPLQDTLQWCLASHSGTTDGLITINLTPRPTSALCSSCNTVSCHPRQTASKSIKRGKKAACLRRGAFDFVLLECLCTPAGYVVMSSLSFLMFYTIWSLHMVFYFDSVPLWLVGLFHLDGCRFSQK